MRLIMRLHVLITYAVETACGKDSLAHSMLHVFTLLENDQRRNLRQIAAQLHHGRTNAPRETKSQGHV